MYPLQNHVSPRGFVPAAFAHVACVKGGISIFPKQVVPNGQDLCHFTMGLCRGLLIFVLLK